VEKITIYEYLANNVPADAHFTINKFGNYRKARSPQELEYQLKNFVKQYGENGLNALAEIHPDRKLLELNCESCNSKSNFSNMNGKEHLQEMPTRFINMSGNDQLRKEQITLAQALIFGGMALVGVAIIMKK
tara:strand:- start:133 stop:528 length:396 start_codon:yes stop_codon:yes gene_type:complete